MTQQHNNEKWWDERQAEYQLAWWKWFDEFAITGPVARNYTAILLSKGLGSFDMLAERLSTDDNYLQSIGFDDEINIHHIKRDCLKNGAGANNGGGNLLKSSSSSSSSSSSAGAAVLVAISPDAIIHENTISSSSSSSSSSSNNAAGEMDGPSHAEQTERTEPKKRKQPLAGIDGMQEPTAGRKKAALSGTSRNNEAVENVPQNVRTLSSSSRMNGSHPAAAAAASSISSSSNSSSASRAMASSDDRPKSLEEIKEMSRHEANQARLTAGTAKKESNEAHRRVATSNGTPYQGGTYRGDMNDDKPDGYGVFIEKGVEFSGRFEKGVFRLGVKKAKATSKMYEEEYAGSFAGNEAWKSWVYSELGVVKCTLDAKANKYESYAGFPLYLLSYIISHTLCHPRTCPLSRFHFLFNTLFHQQENLSMEKDQGKVSITPLNNPQLYVVCINEPT